MLKHDIEHEIARRADGGVIVEIGVGSGQGQVALHDGTTLGRMLMIYAIDPFADYTDLNGAHYGPSTEADFRLNIKPFQEKMRFRRMTGVEAGRTWDASVPVSLVWVDLTDDFESLKAIFDAWKDHIVPGGYIVFTGTEYAFRGCGAHLMQHYSGWHPVDLEGQNIVSILQKPPEKRAVFFICVGDQYIKEAQFCAKSVKANLPSASCIMFCNAEANPPGFDRVVHLPARCSHTWNLDNTRYIAWAYDWLVSAEYKSMLLLDCDTYVCQPCEDIWYTFLQADLAFGHSADRDNCVSLCGVPATFTTPMIGVNLFKASPACKAIIHDWVSLYAANEGFYGENDQLPLRDVLWRNQANARYIVLPPEYACRHNFGVWVKGMVRIIHGRLPFMDRGLDWAAQAINDDHTMRLWHPRWGMLWSVQKERAGEMK